jgi:transposase-like protein
MPQRHLPMFPAGVTHITNELAFERRDGKIAYFNGHMPVFVHAEDDVATFRMITSQFCESGYAKQCDIIRAFGVTSISVKRAVKLYRERGTKGFYAPRPSRGPAVLTAGVMAEIESLLVAGVSLAEVAQKLGLKLNTLQKAVSAGRIRHAAKKRLRRADSGEHEKPAIRNRLRRADGSWGHGDAGTDGGQPWTARGGRTEFQPGCRPTSWRRFAGPAGAIGQRPVESHEQILQPARRLLWSEDDLSAAGFHVAFSDQID